jgi:hypothetical protein
LATWAPSCLPRNTLPSMETIAYVTPPDPSIQAPAPAAATAMQITQANCLYDSNVTCFETHNNVCLELKHMILAAVGDKYVSTLQHPLLCYAMPKSLSRCSSST